MLVETLVLGADRGLEDIGGDLVVAHRLTVLQVQCREQRFAIRSVDLGGFSKVEGIGTAVVGQVDQPGIAQLDDADDAHRTDEYERGREETQREEYGMGLLPPLHPRCS